MDTHKILIVDDDAIVRESFGAHLENLDALLFFAENGTEALSKAAELLPDVILLDVMMPGMDGFEACRLLRASPTLAEVPILMITALDDRASLLLGLEAGADDFLGKPIDHIELRTRIQTILRLNRYRKLMEERIHYNQELEAKNRQLRELSQHLANVQETERRFIAAELHDDIGQLLTGLKLMIEIATAQDGEAKRKTLELAKKSVSELSARVRNLSLDLRPAMLDDFGLFSALEWLFERFTKQTGVLVQHNFNFMEERRFPKQIETAAFRIIQESLTNVARHAEVKNVDVNIFVNGRLDVEIRDQGRGFDPANLNSVSRQTGGISGMRERVSWLGGSLSVISSSGAGTTILASFTLEGDAEHGQN